MKFEVNFKADLTPDKKELLETFLKTYLKTTLKRAGMEPEDLTITLREKPEPIPAISITEGTNED